MPAICWKAVKKNSNNLMNDWRQTAAGYGMEISSDKSKTSVNSIKPRPSANICMNGKTLEKVDQFKYLGSTQTYSK